MGGKGSGGPKGEIIHLDGTTISKNGKLEKTDFFNFLGMDLDDYSDIQLTAEEAISFKNSVIKMSYATSAAVPLRCYGSSCINKSCVFHKYGKYPLTKGCLYEVRMIEILTKSYIDDLNIDPEVRSEMVLVNELVTLEILDYRANLGLSGGTDQEAGSLLKTSITETDKATSETVNIHPLIDVKTRISASRSRILDLFAATRREKYKRAAALKKSEDTDASTFFASIKKQFSDSDIQDKVSDALEADWEEIDR